MEGFHFVMDYIVHREFAAAEERPEEMNFEEYMASRMGFKYKDKDYSKINS